MKYCLDKIIINHKSRFDCANQQHKMSSGEHKLTTSSRVVSIHGIRLERNVDMMTNPPTQLASLPHV